MIQIVISLFFFLLSPLHAQQPTHQVVIREATGDIQYRSINAPVWVPISAGAQLSEKNFVRLNSSDSTLTLSLPDGSLLRFIGIGSFFLEYIGRSIDNNLQTKILNLSGRWFYDGEQFPKTRFIINTDITTAVIEDGSGGGQFANGTNEFVLQSGRGLIGYRRQESKALVVSPNQVVDFNIQDGFFQPKVANAEVLKNYLIFTNNSKGAKPTPSTVNQPNNVIILEESEVLPLEELEGGEEQTEDFFLPRFSYLPLNYRAQQILSFDSKKKNV